MDRSYYVLQAIYGVFNNIGKILLRKSTVFFHKKNIFTPCTVRRCTVFIYIIKSYAVLRRTMYSIIFNLIWMPYNYAGRSGVSTELNKQFNKQRDERNTMYFC